MNKTVALSILKPFIPKLKEYMLIGDRDIRQYLQSLPLQDDETHIVAFSEIDDDVTYIVIGAFRDKTFVRKIIVFPLIDCINTVIQNNLTNGNAK